jgi:ribonuclease HI
MKKSLFNKLQKEIDRTDDIKKAISSLSNEDKRSLIEWINKDIAGEENLIIYTDGASRGNPGKSGYGYIIYRDKVLIEKNYGYLGVKTNNQAEYIALFEAVKSLVKYNCKKVKILMDSQLIVRQLKGIYRVKNEKLRKYYNKINELLNNIDNVQFVHIDRENNSEADKLANKAIDEHNDGLDV